MNKGFRRSVENKLAFWARCAITRRHDMPHVDHYKCNKNEMGLTQYLQCQQKVYSGDNLYSIRVYVKNKNITRLADRPFHKIWAKSDKNIARQVRYYKYFINII